MNLPIAGIGLVLFMAILIPGCKKKDSTLFTKLPSGHSGITFENSIQESPEINILRYEYTYNGGGVAAGDFNNDGLCDLYFTGNAVKNRLYLNQGDLKFKDITDHAGVAGRSRWKTGVTVADVNGDGWLDIYVCYSGPGDQSLSNELYVNSGGKAGDTPTFTEQAALYGLDAPETFSTQASFFDYDRDGDLDMFLINHGNHFFSPFTNTNKLRNTRHPNFGNRLYRNNLISKAAADRKIKPLFTEVSQEAGIHGGGLNFSLGVSISDVNNDGWPDIYVTNDYEEQDFFYLNNKDGSFTDCTKTSFGHLSRNGMGTDIADYNNDGKTDLVEVDMWPEDNFRQKLLKGPDDYNRYMLMVDSGFHFQQMRNTLQLNTGNDSKGIPVFSEIGQLAGVSSTDWSWAPLLVDVDNDGLKDLFITNGYLRDFTSMDFLKYTVEEAKRSAAQKGQELRVYELISKMSSTKTSDYLFRNNGDLTFSDFSRAWGIYEPNLSFGAVYADLDNDGDVELITNNTNETATIWKNNAVELKTNSYLSVSLSGQPGNNFGIGAKVYVECDSMHQFQELYPTRGFQSAVEPILHFGLGSSDAIVKLRVVWPDGKETVLTHPKANSLINIPFASAVEIPVNPDERTTKLFRDISKESNVDFIHHENDFVDFDHESLIPYQPSRFGPALAVGDVNNDGDDDFYVGGAAGQKSVLYLASGDGKFRRAVDQPWEADALCEDEGAVFFDADGDHDLDLFVVSGGNEFMSGSTELDDRLYLNMGKGKFIKAAVGSTPADHVNGSCVTAADFDHDGDLDLFVGGRNQPGKFPLIAPSAILRNDSEPGKHIIKFVVVTKDVNPALRELGMVSDAQWNDFNHDGWPDLVVVGEWMPIRLFENKSGKLEEVINETLKNSAGLWGRVTVADIDEDGDQDFVLGNAGTNLPWHATKDEPLRLYFEDFNGDGKIDPIICNYNQGKSYPVASRDELLFQISSLRSKYPTYASYAGATLEDILGADRVSASGKYEINTLHSSILENVGSGKFNVKELPIRAQFSAVRGIVVDDFDGDRLDDILLAGNFYPYRTQYGRSDAGKGLLLTRSRTKGYCLKDWTETGFYAAGDIRNMMVLKSKSGRSLVMIVRNNESIEIFEVMGKSIGNKM